MPANDCKLNSRRVVPQKKGDLYVEIRMDTCCYSKLQKMF